MKEFDEETQKKIEAGLETDGDALDLQAYREVFRRVNHKPEIALSGDFADRIVIKVLERKLRRESKDYVWFGIGITLLVITFAIAVMMSGFRFELGFLRQMSPYSGVFIFGMIFILVLNRLDKKLVIRKKE